jgi:hypothetical protein
MVVVIGFGLHQSVNHDKYSVWQPNESVFAIPGNLSGMSTEAAIAYSTCKG